MSLREDLQKLSGRSQDFSPQTDRTEKKARIKAYAEKIWMEEILPGMTAAANAGKVEFCYSFLNKDYDIWDDLGDHLSTFAIDCDLGVDESVCDCLTFSWH